MKSDVRAYWDTVTNIHPDDILLVCSVKDDEGTPGFVSMPVHREAFIYMLPDQLLTIMDEAAESVLKERRDEIAKRGSDSTLPDCRSGYGDLHSGL